MLAPSAHLGKAPAPSSRTLRKRLLVIMIGLNLLLACGLITRHLMMESARRTAERKVLSETATEYTRIGALVGNDGARWTDVMQSTKESGRISDADLDWLLARMADGDARKSQSGLRHDMMQDALLQVKHAPPAQREKMFQTTAALFARPDYDGIGGDQVTAMAEFRHLRDTRAIPLVVPYASDKRLLLRIAAVRTLQRLGYSGLTPTQLQEMAKADPHRSVKPLPAQ